MGNERRVAVVGAGAFGGWTALMLQRSGADVTLLDAWGPGHARASSGGETRVLRLSYPNPEMLRLARRARRLWIEEERRCGLRLFEPIGLLWMSPCFGAIEESVMEGLRSEGEPHQRLDRAELERKYPQIRCDDLEGAIFEPGAGFLRAREACLAVRDRFVVEGGTYIEAWAEPGPIRDGELLGVRLPDGSSPQFDAYVFAGGPWLAGQFGSQLGVSLPVSRQEVFVFGTSEHDDRFGPTRLPVWAWVGDRFWYGVPGEGRVGGFKVADDTRGPTFDPSSGDRSPSAEGLDRARSFLSDRFPGLSGAPLINAAVCQYTDAPEGRFIADRLPGVRNAWVVGGGSGHGFKHGPAVGEYVASLVSGEVEPGSEPAFSTIAEAKTAR